MILTALLLATMGAAPQAAAIAADPVKAPAVAPNIPLVSEASDKGSTPQPQAGPRTELGALADGEPPATAQAATWKSIPEAKRRLLIMGSSDGFAVAGPKAPCFAGRTVERLDQELMAAGFGDKSPDRLPEAMSFIATEGASCADAPSRSYDTAYLYALPEESLALYLTGVIRAYARISPCPAEAQSNAALLTLSVLGLAPQGTNPITALKASVVEGCGSQKAG